MVSFNSHKHKLVNLLTNLICSGNSNRPLAEFFSLRFCSENKRSQAKHYDGPRHLLFFQLQPNTCVPDRLEGLQLSSVLTPTTLYPVFQCLPPGGNRVKHGAFWDNPFKICEMNLCQVCFTINTTNNQITTVIYLKTVSNTYKGHYGTVP